MSSNATVKRTKRLFLLDRAKKRPATFAALHPDVITSAADVRSSVGRASRDSLWVSYAPGLTEALVRSLTSAPGALGSGLFLHPLDVKVIPALTSAFQRIAFTTDEGFIPAEELVDVLKAENRSEFFIGGIVNHSTETITFWRGNLEPLTVPFSTFEPSGDGTEPDFNDFSVIDSGQTVRLGRYEAAADAILYEHDPGYRRAMAKKRLREDRSFGASLRRLRTQRGLRREDFEPDVSGKTVARIEQGKVKRIQPRTLVALAKRLVVEPDEIGDY